MNHISLSNEETKVIFSDEAFSNLASLDGTQQEQVLRRLLSIVESEMPPHSFIHEAIGNLDILTAGGQCRLYTKIVENIPQDDTRYHIIHLFYIDESHEYPQRALATYSSWAEQKVDEIATLATVSDVEQYLEEHDALSEEDLRDMIS